MIHVCQSHNVARGRERIASRWLRPNAHGPGLRYVGFAFVLICALTTLSGTLGRAILRGILSSPPYNSGKNAGTRQGDSDEPGSDALNTPTRFVACVTRESSAQDIEADLLPLTTNLSILQNDNHQGAFEADVVLLACKPQLVSKILGAPGMRDALRGKLLISILAGVPVQQIEQILDDSGGSWEGFRSCCRVVRVMPNTASAIGESMTVIATSEPPLPPHQRELVTWMFSRIGRVVTLPEHLMDASTALCGSGPAFYALLLEAMADGAVAMGLPRREAQHMAAQTMKGAAGLVLAGEHPALLRDKVSTPGGCTIGGLLVLEEGRVRGTVARAVREATVVASQLGKGVQGVNGTRF